MKRGQSTVLDAVRQKFTRWCGDLTTLPEVTLPPELYNRRGDNWEILFQLAHLAGQRWWNLTLDAALADAAREAPVEGTAIPLLSDIRTVLGTKARLRTEDLISGLLNMPDPSGEWRRCNRGGEVSAYYLRTQLRNLLDPPGAQKWKERGATARGYLVAQFKDAFERYLDGQAGQAEKAPPQQAGTSPGASASEDRAQPEREHSGAEAAVPGTSKTARATLRKRHARFPPFSSAPSASSASSATGTNKRSNNKGSEAKKQGRMRKSPSATSAAASATGDEAGAAAGGVSDGTAPMADGFPLSATAKVQTGTASFSKVADGADGADENGEKRVRVLQRPGSLTAERNRRLKKPANGVGPVNEELL